MYVIWGTLLGLKYVKRVLLFTAMFNIFNISLSLLFVMYFKWESFGVGLATALSDISIFLIMLIHLFREKLISRLFLPSIKDMKKLLISNFDIMFRTILLISFISLFTNISSSMSKDILVSNSILQKIFIVCAYFFDGLAFSFESIIGSLKGSGNIKAVKDAVKKGLNLTALMAIGCILFLSLFEDLILRFFIDKPFIIEIAKNSYHFVLIAVAGSFAFLFDGIFIGLMEFKKMRNSVFLGLLLSSPFLIYSYFNQNNLFLWIGFITFFYTRSFCLLINYKTLVKTQ